MQMSNTTREEKGGCPERAFEIPPQLITADLSLNFGGIQALSDISLEIHKGEIFSIIGPNGAGKTCILNCINGL